MSRIKPSFQRCLLLVGTFLFLTVVLLVGRAAAQSQAGGLVLPPGFATARVADGLNAPVEMRFTPAGDIIVGEHGSGEGDEAVSAIKYVRNGVVLPTPVLQLSTNIESGSGFLGFTLDPDFADNGYLYIYYAPGRNAFDWTGEPTVRLSRFTFDHTTLVADPASELVVLEADFWHVFHLGHAIEFDQDGNLWLAIGEIALRNQVQDVSSLVGKLLRIRPNDTGYTIPADNPYLDDPTARPELYAIGLRQPWRIAFRQSDGLPVLADIGGIAWEEIDLISPAANYGWPEREGPCAQREIAWPCSPTPPQYTDPIIWYNHDPGDQGGPERGAVTGLTFYEGTDFPDDYHNKLFFGDLSLGFIKYADPEMDWQVGDFATGIRGLVDLDYYNGQLYYTSIDENAIFSIYHTGSSNQSPAATLTTSVTQGEPDLTVQFSATAIDPDDNVLRYHWNFGDGTPALITSVPTTTHTYTENGTYIAELQVKDLRGGQSGILAETITVYDGELPTIDLQNLTEPNRTTYHGGDEFSYAAVRSTVEGLDATAPYQWRMILHHNTHEHTIFSGNETTSDTVRIPTENHDGDVALWYRFELTMQTEAGQQIIVSRSVFPELVDLTFNTNPAAEVNVTLNDVEELTDFTYETIVGIENVATASDMLISNGGIYRFMGWQVEQHGLIQAPTIHFFAPSSNTTYQARYVFARSAENIYLPILQR